MMAAGTGVPLPPTIWPVAQLPAAVQRKGRYVPESFAHPGKMLPAIVREAVSRFTVPGDLVVDPMCGIGTTLVEAIHLGRHADGIEYESRWANTAALNVALAARQGATGRATVTVGDARHLDALVRGSAVGTAALIVTSPPYGSWCHGVASTGPQPVRVRNHRYSDDRGNLADGGAGALFAGFGQILGHCASLLRPGGTMVVTSRPWRERGELIDLPGAVLALAVAAGLHPIGRHVALLAAIRDGELIPRASFFQMVKVREARARGIQSPCYWP